MAGRLFALERAGELTVARGIADVDAALAEGAPPVAVLHLEGAEAIDPGLEALPAWYAMGLRSLGPVWSRANDFATGVQFVLPSSPDIGPGLTDAGVALVKACAELGILDRPQPPEREGLLGRRQARTRAAGRQPLRRARRRRRPRAT